MTLVDKGENYRIFKDKILKPGSYRGRKNTSPENTKTINGSEHA